MKRILAFAVLSVALSGTAALADPSCSTWNWQSDGVYWQTCVNDDGSQHCYQAADANGTGAHEVACSS